MVVAVQSLSPVQLFATPQTATRQVSWSFTISRTLLKLMSIESVMPSNHLILSFPLHLLPSIILNICSMPTNPKKTLLGIWDTWQSKTDVVLTLIKLTLVSKGITRITTPILVILSHHKH